MKKISLILTVALLLSSMASLFGIAVSAEGDPGVVVYQNSSYTWVASYYYESDDIAIANGAIAKFTNVSDNKTNYLKEWRAIGAFGNATNYGCGDTITLIADATQKISVPSNISLDVGSRIFTIDGNGITFEGAGRVEVCGNDAGAVTLKNLNVTNTSESAAAMQLGTDSKGAKVILDNTVVETKNSPTYAAVINKSSDLVLTNGSQIKSVGATSKTNVSGGVHLMSAAPTLTVEEGTSIVATGIAINNVSADGEVKINGGTVRSTGGTEELRRDAIQNTSGLIINSGIVEAVYGRAIYSYGVITQGVITSSSDTKINGGTVMSGGGYATLHVSTNGTITVNGGLITTSAPTTALSVGLAIVGEGSKMGGTLKVNGGTFYYLNATKNAPMIKAHESSNHNHTVYLNGGDFIGSSYIFNGNYNNEASERVTLDKPAVYTGASIRTASDSTGLRFRSIIQKSAIDAAEALKKSGTEVKYGTLIVPTEYLDATDGIFTASALKRAGKKYADIPATANGKTTDADGNVMISAAIVNLYRSNYEREFSAVAYLSYETENGTITVYSTYNEEKHSRSAEQVAYAALADVKTESAGYYTTLVTEWYELVDGNYVAKSGQAYSPYKAEQIEVIKSYIVSPAKGGSAQ